MITIYTVQEFPALGTLYADEKYIIVFVKERCSSLPCPSEDDLDLSGGKLFKMVDCLNLIGQ